MHAVSTLGPGYFMLSLFMASRQSCTLSPISLFLILDRCPTARRSLEHLFFIPSHPNIITDPLSCHSPLPPRTDMVKTRLQSGNALYTGPISAAKAILKSEGVAGFYRGMCSAPFSPSLFPASPSSRDPACSTVALSFTH